MSSKKLLVTGVFIGVIISTLINYFGSQTSYLLITYLMILTSSFLFIKELRVIGEYSIAYMFNLRTDFFKKRIERPRLFVYLTFGTLNLLIIFQYYELNKSVFLNRYLFTTLYFLLFAFCNFILMFSWHKNFEEKFIVQVQKKVLNKKNQNYTLKWHNEADLRSIYKKLEERDLIELLDVNSEKLDYILFSELLIRGKTPEHPIFKLNMDNIQTKYFYNLLSQDSQGFTLDDFLKIFKNKNQRATRNSIEASFSNAQSAPKRKKDIELVFLD